MFNTETNGANFQYIIHVKHRPSLAMFFFSCISSSYRFFKSNRPSHTNVSTACTYCINLINLVPTLHGSNKLNPCKKIKNYNSFKQPGGQELLPQGSLPRMHYKGITSSILERHRDLELCHHLHDRISVETISPTLKLSNLSFNINEYTNRKKKQHMKAVQLGA